MGRIRPKPTGFLAAVPIAPGARLEADAPVRLFHLETAIEDYDVTPDGSVSHRQARDESESLCPAGFRRDSTSERKLEMTMKGRTQLIGAMRTSVMALALVTLAGALLAQSPQERLAGSAKDARDQLQNARTDLQNTVGALNDLRNEKGDLRPAYERYSDSIEKTRNSAALASKLAETMSADSKTYFDSWRSEINTISNKDIQKTSTKRMNTVQKEYDNVLKQLKPLKPLFNPMMSDLDDFKKALGMDLTPAGLKAHSKAMDKTNKSLTAFQEPIVKSLTELDKLATDLTPAAQ